MSSRFVNLFPFLADLGIETGSNGANLSYPQEFGIDNTPVFPDGTVNVHASRNQWILGFISSCPYIAIALL